MEPDKLQEQGQVPTYDLEFNKSLFPLEVIQTACFDFLNKAFALFEEHDDRVRVTLRPNDEQGSEVLPKEFQNHLIQLTSAFLHRKKNEQLRELVRMHAQKTQVQIQETGFDDPAFADLEKSLSDLSTDSLDDPLGISEPWRPNKKIKE